MAVIFLSNTALYIQHCGLENNITFLSPTHKMDGGHESRAKSVWEIRIIKILDLPPQRDNSVIGVGYSISRVKNCSKSKSETTFTLKKTALIHESVSEIFF